MGGVSLGVGDNINILAPKPTNKNKVSFRYDKEMSKLTIAVCYTHIVINNDENLQSALVGLPQGYLIRGTAKLVLPKINAPAGQVEETTQVDSTDIVNCQLMIANRRNTVRSMQNGTACVVAEDGSESSLQLPEDHANDLVDEHNL